VLRHAGPTARATVRLSFEPAALAITVTDDGSNGDHQAAGGSGWVAPPGEHGQGPVTEERAGGSSTGHGLTGMAERAAAVGGEVTAGPHGEGGFEVSARLPLAGDAG